MISVRNIVPNETLIDKESYKHVSIYYIGYMTVKNLTFMKVNNANAFC